MSLELPNLVKRRDRHEVFAACIGVVGKMIATEKIAAVFVAATTKLLSGVFAACVRDVKRAEAQSAVEPFLPALIEKLGDNVARVRDPAVATVLEVGRTATRASSMVPSPLLVDLSFRSWLVRRP